MERESVLGVIERLRDSVDLREAAAVLLPMTVHALDPLTARSAMRASLHLRPADGAWSLHSVRAAGSAWQADDTGEATPSSTVWSLLERARTPLLVDLLTGSAEGLAGDPDSVSESAAGPSSTTLARLADNGATHVCALPLYPLRGGALAGMVTLEVSFDAPATAWPDVRQACELLQLCAPWVLSLPLPAAARTAESVDPLLPVIGEAVGAQLPMLRAFAALNDHLLIVGPTGAGKSRLAAWAHARSRVASGPFESIDFHAIPAEMQAAELVGWKRGAFTGATGDHDGALRRATGGTLFIDEIDKLSLETQAGLLRVLESGRYRPLGSAGAEAVADARIIIGTNADLPAMVRAGTFREDLYYRINVLSARLPPLADRLDEIPAWTDHMLGVIGATAVPGRPVRAADEAVAALSTLPWPGNLRQLENTLRRCLAIALTDAAEGAVTISREHVRIALAMDTEPARAGGPELAGGLREAADEFVDLVLERRDRGAELRIDARDVFNGFVLLRALERLDQDPRRVFDLLGRDASIANRNHVRDLRRELGRAQEMLQLLGENGSAVRIQALLDALAR